MPFVLKTNLLDGIRSLALSEASVNLPLPTEKYSSCHQRVQNTSIKKAFGLHLPANMPQPLITPFLLLISFASIAVGEGTQTLFRLDLNNGAVGFKDTPKIIEKSGTRCMAGPAELALPQTQGIITVRFGMLGFASTEQSELAVLLSDANSPLVTIRNVNSSGRIDDRTVISDKNQFVPGKWHNVEMRLDTRKGNLKVICDGRLRYDETLPGAADRKLAGIRFGKQAVLDSLSIDVAPLPAEDPAAAKLSALQKTLSRQIRALPERSPEEVRKKAILLYHLEKIDKAIAQSAFGIGLEIAADLEAGLNKNIGRMQGGHAWLRPVRQPQNNPYLDPEMNRKWFAEFTSRPDYPWALPTPDKAAYEGLHKNYGIRDQADNANSWLLLHAHPQSPLRDKTELLVRAMRRIDAYMEDCHFGRKHDDFFALGPALMGAVMIDKMFPEMLLPTQRKHWTEVAQTASQWFRKMNYTGKYSNADLGASRIFLASGMFTGNKADQEQGLKLAYSWGDNIYEDGASAYIDGQNESPGYHATCIAFEFDNFVMLNDPKLEEILRRVEYYPVSCTDSNLTVEWFTAPSWKQAWYNASPFRGTSSIYYLTGNPYYLSLGPIDRFDKPTEPSMKHALIYKSHPKTPFPLPSNYTLYDRNIQGARMNYGPYSAAMNGRVTPSLVGKNTYVGLTLAEPPKGDARAFSAAVYGVNLFPVIDKSGINTISDEYISVVVGRNFASLGADYTLARRMAGPSRKEVPWKGRQVWLLLPGRMIGLVELTPEGKQNATAVTMNIELGRGKAGAFDTSPIRVLNDHESQFGKLRITVHDTNLKGVKSSDKPDNLSNEGQRGIHHEWHLVDAPNLPEWSKDQRDYEAVSHALVELRVDSPQADKARVEKVVQEGFIGVSAEFASCKYTALYNPGTTPATVSTAPFSGKGNTSVFADRRTFAPPIPAPGSLTLASKESIIIVSGDDPRLHKTGFVGWKPFLEYFQNHRSEFTSPLATGGR